MLSIIHTLCEKHILAVTSNLSLILVYSLSNQIRNEICNTNTEVKTTENQRLKLELSVTQIKPNRENWNTRLEKFSSKLNSKTELNENLIQLL